MKVRSIKMAVLSTFLVLASPLAFAGSQSTGMHVPSQSEMQNRDGVTQAVQQGKGSGMTRNQEVRANAYRSQTAGESPTVRNGSGAGDSNRGDMAFRK
jgi:hypothetical protein